jgi:hypothetical protein
MIVSLFRSGAGSGETAALWRRHGRQGCVTPPATVDDAGRKHCHFSLAVTAATASPPSFVVTPASQGPMASGLAASHAVARRRLLAVVQDRAHDLVLHGQREFQVGRNLPTFGHSADKPARVLVATSAPPRVGAEPVVAARQIGHLEIGVHRMRFPAQEHDGLARGSSARRPAPASPVRAFHEVEADRPKASAAIMSRIRRLPSLPGSMP